VSDPGSSRGASVRRSAHKAAPRRNSAPKRRNAQAGQAPDGHHQRDAPSPGAEPAVSELAALASGRGFQEWIEPATTASAAGLIANAATVTGRNGPPGGPGGDHVARVTRPMTGRFAQVRGWPSPIQRLPSGALPAARTGARRPTRTHVRRPKRPPLLYFPAVLAVRVVRISFLTCGAKRARTADLLRAIWRRRVHPRPSVRVTVLPRPRESVDVRVSCCTSVLYHGRRVLAHLVVARPRVLPGGACAFGCLLCCLDLIVGFTNRRWARTALRRAVHFGHVLARLTYCRRGARNVRGGGRGARRD
jgi:hypothetical protein